MRFKSKPEEERRSETKLLRLTTHELQSIQKAADVRGLPFIEFVRRAALSRKADVRYEDQIILELRAVVQTFRVIHKEFVARGMAPPDEEFRTVIREAVEAMLRISK